MSALTQLLAPVLALVDLSDFPVVLAGHGYDTGGPSRDDRGGDDGDEGGIGTTTLVALAGLAAITVGVLVSLDPSRARARLRAIRPVALPMVFITVPLAAWALASGGPDATLLIERGTALTGRPELLISLLEDDLNTSEMTGGRASVRVECRGRDGRLVLGAEQRWPFVDERGYDYPHAHQPATREQLLRIDRCRLLDTHVTLEAVVEGVVPEGAPVSRVREAAGDV